MSGNLDQKLFEIITHLVCSAPVSLEETPVLGAFRMVDAASRLMELAEKDEAFGRDEFLSRARADLLAHVNLAMTDQPAFEAWLAENVESFTREARRRARDCA
ncbi:DUF6092 family protein [Streptomyces sp. NPDC004609]|uniref:DUF6092 family protein n=1 Tax=Streptomyces sp. NPDC004609 TaxID=3364704 RepID=UPI0036C62395